MPNLENKRTEPIADNVFGYDEDESFVYERLHTAPGIKLEIVAGGAGYSQKVRMMLARQVWSENAREGYRTIEHNEAGAPLLAADAPDAEHQRISVSHTTGLLAVATLPPSKRNDDAGISGFSKQTALGLDVERTDRTQVLGVRSRFLSEEEMNLIPENSVTDNILAWTCKEAMMKMTFNTSADIRKEILIRRLPDLAGNPGEGTATLADGTRIQTRLHSLPLGGGRFAATLAFTDETLRFGNRNK